MKAARCSPAILRYCKRGHLRTEKSTFPRKVRIGGKEYVVRECRKCHAMRNVNRLLDKRHGAEA